jgi:CheY-like chemotaxis protein
MQSRILVVDDERNIRMTFVQALETLDVQVQSAVNGEEALRMFVEEGAFSLVFLDLRMPGMDGLQVLRQIHEGWPGTRVVIMTAFGSIESAVEAMKLGAVDFLRKPCMPEDIRMLSETILAREILEEKPVMNGQSLIELAKRMIADHHTEEALRVCRKALSLEPVHPEVYNLLGIISELRGDQINAQRYYRASLDMYPTYEPAWANLERLVRGGASGRYEVVMDSGGAVQGPPADGVKDHD